MSVVLNTCRAGFILLIFYLPADLEIKYDAHKCVSKRTQEHGCTQDLEQAECCTLAERQVIPVS